MRKKTTIEEIIYDIGQSWDLEDFDEYENIKIKVNILGDKPTYTIETKSFSFYNVEELQALLDKIKK